MRKAMTAIAFAMLAVPAAAQDRAADTARRAGDAVESIAPAIDGAADAMLDLDVGPIIDAADPYRRPYARSHRTLREIGRRNDPYFEHRLRGQIYGTTAAMARMMDAIAAAEPAMRRSFFEMERGIAEAVRAAPRRRLPPGDVDDDWDRDFDDEGPYDDPYGD